MFVFVRVRSEFSEVSNPSIVLVPVEQVDSLRVSCRGNIEGMLAMSLIIVETEEIDIDL